MTDSVINLVDRLHAAQHLAHLVELAAAEACSSELARDAMSTALADVQERIAAVAEELKTMVRG